MVSERDSWIEMRCCLYYSGQFQGNQFPLWIFKCEENTTFLEICGRVEEVWNSGLTVFINVSFSIVGQVP